MSMPRLKSHYDTVQKSFADFFLQECSLDHEPHPYQPYQPSQHQHSYHHHTSHHISHHTSHHPSQQLFHNPSQQPSQQQSQLSHHHSSIDESEVSQLRQSLRRLQNENEQLKNKLEVQKECSRQLRQRLEAENSQLGKENQKLRRSRNLASKSKVNIFQYDPPQLRREQSPICRERKQPKAIEVQCDLQFERTQTELRQFIEICKKETMSMRLQTAIKGLVVKLLVKEESGLGSEQCARSEYTVTSRSKGETRMSRMRQGSEGGITRLQSGIERQALLQLHKNTHNYQQLSSSTSPLPIARDNSQNRSKSRKKIFS